MNKRRVITAVGILAFLIAVLALCTTFVLPGLVPASDEARRKIATGDIANISVALKLYRLHRDRYPTTEEGLAVLLIPFESKDWNQPFLEGKPIDPWGRAYQYRCPGTRHAEGFDLWSLGPDGKDGTEDDIMN
jgi:general secretion pathway protein G